MFFLEGLMQTDVQIEELVHNPVIKSPSFKKERGQLFRLSQSEKDRQSWTDQQEQGQPYSSF